MQKRIKRALYSLCEVRYIRIVIDDIQFRYIGICGHSSPPLGFRKTI